MMKKGVKCLVITVDNSNSKNGEPRSQNSEVFIYPSCLPKAHAPTDQIKEFFRRQLEAWTSEAIMNKLSGILPKKIFNRKIKISEKIGKTPKRSFSVKNLVIITGFR